MLGFCLGLLPVGFLPQFLGLLGCNLCLGRLLTISRLDLSLFTAEGKSCASSLRGTLQSVHSSGHAPIVHCLELGSKASADMCMSPSAHCIGSNALDKHLMVSCT